MTTIGTTTDTLERAVGKGLLLGEQRAFEGEMARLFARVRRVDGPRSWIISLRVFIICDMDGDMAAGLR